MRNGTLGLVALGLLAGPMAAHAIKNGDMDDDGHPYVGIMVAKINGQPAWRCSGTLISPNLFLTAGQAGRLRRQTVEHTFGTLKSWMGATHFLTRSMPRGRTEMSLQVLAYNLKRVMQILGVQPLITAMRTYARSRHSVGSRYEAIGENVFTRPRPEADPSLIVGGTLRRSPSFRLLPRESVPTSNYRAISWRVQSRRTSGRRSGADNSA